MDDTAHWHGAPIGDAAYGKARPELEATLAELEARL